MEIEVKKTSVIALVMGNVLVITPKWQISAIAVTTSQAATIIYN